VDNDYDTKRRSVFRKVTAKKFARKLRANCCSSGGLIQVCAGTCCQEIAVVSNSAIDCL